MCSFKASLCLNFIKSWWIIDKEFSTLKKQEQKDKKCWKTEHHTPIHTALIIYWVQGQQYEIFMYEHQPTSYKSTMKNKVRDIS